MRAAVAMILASMLVAPVAGSDLEVSAKSSLSFDAEGAKTRPINKVITLIKDMLKEMEKEAAEDKEINEKMTCWCETNTKEKTKSIADAEQRIADLTTSIEGDTATSSRLDTEVKHLKHEADADQNALDTATALRAKQLKEFTAEEQNLIQTIGSLKSATETLAGSSSSEASLKAKQTSFMQMQHQSRFENVATAVQNAMEKHASLLVGVLTPSQRKTAAAFIQAGYAPEGGEILGILNQMKETFESNLATAQKKEATGQKNYEELKTAKEAEIAAGEVQSDTKTQELADTNEKNAQAKSDLIDTQKDLAADQKFMKMLEEKCALSAADYEHRTKSRHEEVAACNKALEMLTSDDAHDLFGKSLGFMQMESSMHSERRTQASKLLSELAIKLHNPRLASLAIRTRVDVFEDVKKSIGDMVVALKHQEAEEIKKLDFCVEEFNKQEIEKEVADHAKAQAEQKIEDLKANIKELTEAIAQLHADIAEMQKEMKYAGEDREKENKEFQLLVADQRATQNLLKSVINVLSEQYEKNTILPVPNATALLQSKQPAGFDEHKKNAKAPGLIGMIKQIQWDAAATEAEAIRSEADSQQAYESLVRDTNESIDAKTRDIVNKSEAKSKADADLVEMNEKHEGLVTSLENIAAANAATHDNCDFVVKGFEARQKTRDEEADAMVQGIAILDGLKFKEFLQTA